MIRFAIVRPLVRYIAAFAFGVVLLGAIPSASRADACIPADKCCRICDGGQACGNSCIARGKTCHKGRGCACDSAEICR